MKRKAISLLLALAMILTFMPAMAFAGTPAESSKEITVKVTAYDDNNICEITPKEGITVDIDNPGTEDKISITASQLVRTNSKFNFRYSAEGDYPSAWKVEASNGSIAVKEGETIHNAHKFDILNEDTSYGYINGVHGITATDVDNACKKSTDEKGVIDNRALVLYGPTKPEPVKIIAVDISVKNTDFFSNSNDFRNADNLLMYTKDGALTRCDNQGRDKNNKNKEDWLLDKAAPIEEQIDKAVADAEKAKANAKKSADAAEAAAKTPGDAAVAAAQKAVDDNNAAQAAEKKLEDLIAALKESKDLDYVKNAIDFSSRPGVTDDQKDSVAAFSNTKTKSDTIVATYPKELKDAMNVSKALLSQTKSENAELRAAADAAAAAALRYTPAQAKIKSVKAGKKKATVRFKKVSKNVTGYEIQISDKNTGAVVKTVYAKKSKKKVIKKTVKGLSKKTRYTAMVRAYNTVDGKTYYGAWSKAKGFKTRK
jgi:outer membrane lipoprotein-sorting protein